MANENLKRFFDGQFQDVCRLFEHSTDEKAFAKPCITLLADPRLPLVQRVTCSVSELPTFVEACADLGIVDACARLRQSASRSGTRHDHFEFGGGDDREWDSGYQIETLDRSSSQAARECSADVQ